MFHESVLCMAKSKHRLYESIVKHRIAQGKFKLAEWMRRSKVWMLKPDVIMMLFNTCVMPTFEYGVGLWGVASVCGQVWNDVDCFSAMITPYILHVPSQTPHAALVGELGWRPYSIRAVWQAATLWMRVTRMDDTVVVRLLDKRCMNNVACCLSDNHAGWEILVN